MTVVTLENWPPEGYVMSEADKVRLWYMQQDAQAAARKKVLVDLMHTGVLPGDFEVTLKDIADMIVYRKKERIDRLRKERREQELLQKLDEAQKKKQVEQAIVDTWMTHILDHPCTEESIARRLRLCNANEAGEGAGGSPPPRGKTLPILPVQPPSIPLDLTNRVDTILKASFEAVGNITSQEYYLNSKEYPIAVPDLEYAEEDEAEYDSYVPLPDFLLESLIRGRLLGLGITYDAVSFDMLRTGLRLPVDFDSADHGIYDDRFEYADNSSAGDDWIVCSCIQLLACWSRLSTFIRQEALPTDDVKRSFAEWPAECKEKSWEGNWWPFYLMIPPGERTEEERTNASADVQTYLDNLEASIERANSDEVKRFILFTLDYIRLGDRPDMTSNRIFRSLIDVLGIDEWPLRYPEPASDEAVCVG